MVTSAFSLVQMQPMMHNRFIIFYVIICPLPTTSTTGRIDNQEERLDAWITKAYESLYEFPLRLLSADEVLEGLERKGRW